MPRKLQLMMVCDWFYPAYKAGGPVVSTTNLAQALRGSYDVRVLTSDTDHGDQQPCVTESDAWIPFNGVQVQYLSQTHRSWRRLFATYRSLSPDVWYLNHLYSPKFVLLPLLMHALGLLKGRLVLCPRGGLNPSAVQYKAYKKKPLIWFLNGLGIARRITFHATNEWEAGHIRRHFPAARVEIADNFPVPYAGPPAPIVKEPSVIRLLFVGRVVDIKNLRFLLGVLKTCPFKGSLEIIGPLEDIEYWRQCEEDIKQLPGNLEVRYLGAMPQGQVREHLERCHFFVLPTRGENYGHAIVEAWMAGKPVIISDQTPWRNLSAQHVGWDLPLDAAAWHRILEDISTWDNHTYQSWIKAIDEHAKKLAERKDLLQRYEEVFGVVSAFA
ncbi:MAG TPA: glycosyltransferase family 4 protein [Luteibaculaceae bacterium]|nr:glycosyltransferase family 4 protein [Luteibaculaceae bacterium]